MALRVARASLCARVSAKWRCQERLFSAGKTISWQPSSSAVSRMMNRRSPEKIWVLKGQMRTAQVQARFAHQLRGGLAVVELAMAHGAVGMLRQRWRHMQQADVHIDAPLAQAPGIARAVDDVADALDRQQQLQGRRLVRCQAHRLHVPWRARWRAHGVAKQGVQRAWKGPLSGKRPHLSQRHGPCKLAKWRKGFPYGRVFSVAVGGIHRAHRRMLALHDGAAWRRRRGAVPRPARCSGSSAHRCGVPS